MTPLVSQTIVTVTLNPTIDRIIEVPGFHLGGHLKGRSRSRLPAGKAINVSRAMSDLGCPSTAAGWVGAESLPLFEEALRRSATNTCFTPIAGATRENITVIDPVGQSETHIRDTGPTVSENEVICLRERLLGIAGPDVLFVFTGSCAPGLSAQRFAEIISTCIDCGCRVAVDGSGDALREAAKLPLWLIKPNLLELGELLGYQVSHESEILAAGRQLAERIAVVLITMGERGAFCFAGGRVLKGRASVPADRIRSTVGCGDAMLAGFLAATSRPGWRLDEAFRQALVVSAASAMSDRPAVFDPSQVGQIAEAAQLDEIPLPTP